MEKHEGTDEQSKALKDSDLDKVVGGAEYVESPVEFKGFMKTTASGSCYEWTEAGKYLHSGCRQICEYCLFYGSNDERSCSISLSVASTICTNLSNANMDILMK